MIELLCVLETNGVTNFLISGGGRDFMLPISAEMYDIPPDCVIDSSVSYEFLERTDGGDVMTHPQ